jgi:hypothetical protein
MVKPCHSLGRLLLVLCSLGWHYISNSALSHFGHCLRSFVLFLGLLRLGSHRIGKPSLLDCTLRGWRSVVTMVPTSASLSVRAWILDTGDPSDVVLLIVKKERWTLCFTWICFALCYCYLSFSFSFNDPSRARYRFSFSQISHSCERICSPRTCQLEIRRALNLRKGRVCSVGMDAGNADPLGFFSPFLHSSPLTLPLFVFSSFSSSGAYSAVFARYHIAKMNLSSRQTYFGDRLD